MTSLLPARQLLQLASEAAERSLEDGLEAFTAIVFSIAAFEGYLNEISEMVRVQLKLDPHDSHPAVMNLAQILPKLEESHAQLELKLAVLDAVMGKGHLVAWSAACSGSHPAGALTEFHTSLSTGEQFGPAFRLTIARILNLGSNTDGLFPAKAKRLTSSTPTIGRNLQPKR